MKAPAFLSNVSVRQWLAIAAAVLAVFGVTVAINHDSGNGTTTVTITVKTPTGEKQVSAPAAAIEQASENGDHTDLAKPVTCDNPKLPDGSTSIDTLHEKIDCVTSAQLAAGVKQQTALARKDRLPEFNVAAATSVRGCSSKWIKRNYSSRGGVRPRLIVLHQTISADNGQKGVDNITVYFGLQGPAVSSNFVHAGATDACNYIVPMSQKPWTQTGFNSLSVSIEVTGTQTQGYYTKGDGTISMYTLIYQIANEWKIPIRRGATSGCSYRTSGVVDHDQLGACGGGHNDVNPYRKKIPQLIAGAKRCQELARLRKTARSRKAQKRTPAWTKSRTARAQTLKKQFRGYNVRCV